ncbi:MAG: LacI family DNA-binding transcriptional regulator [Rhizobiaceae bacterium]
MARIADIAKAAGVSTAVVSRVINQDKTLRISEETRTRVLKTIEEFDYTPNSAASSLRSSKSGLIALVVDDVTNPITTEILRGAQDRATSFGQAILIGEVSALDDRFSRIQRFIGGNGVDGLIIHTSSISDQVVEQTAKKDFPTVLLQAESKAEVVSLSLPDREATELATRHLLELGHVRIACLAAVRARAHTQRRIDGWASTMKSAGFGIDEGLLEISDQSIDDGRRMTRKLLSAQPAITGLVCCNLVSAIGALEAALQMDIKVPEDLSIISIHDIELARHLRVPLTTVKMPLFDLGVHAMEIIQEEPGTSSAHMIVHEQPELILRSSTRALA